MRMQGLSYSMEWFLLVWIGSFVFTKERVTANQYKVVLSGFKMSESWYLGVFTLVFEKLYKLFSLPVLWNHILEREKCIFKLSKSITHRLFFGNKLKGKCACMHISIRPLFFKCEQHAETSQLKSDFIFPFLMIQGCNPSPAVTPTSCTRALF